MYFGSLICLHSVRLAKEFQRQVNSWPLWHLWYLVPVLESSLLVQLLPFSPLSFSQSCAFLRDVPWVLPLIHQCQPVSNFVAGEHRTAAEMLWAVSLDQAPAPSTPHFLRWSVQHRPGCIRRCALPAWIHLTWAYPGPLPSFFNFIFSVFKGRNAEKLSFPLSCRLFSR